MVDVRSGIAPGDTVVIVDRAGQLVRFRGRALRGIVLSIAFGDHFRILCGADAMATVSLVRSGRQASIRLDCLRRCPQLAYVRPQELSRRGAQ